jgi:hypothetical protein
MINILQRCSIHVMGRTPLTTIIEKMTNKIYWNHILIPPVPITIALNA